MSVEPAERRFDRVECDAGLEAEMTKLDFLGMISYENYYKLALGNSYRVFAAQEAVREVLLQQFGYQEMFIIFPSLSVVNMSGRTKDFAGKEICWRL